MSTIIPLPGLLGSHPLAALASFGLLQTVSAWDPSARLSFALRDEWQAQLHSDVFADADALIAKLAEWQASDALNGWFNWADDVRVPPDDYRAALTTALAANDLPKAAWLRALAALGAVDRQKGLVKPTAFYMVSGQQSLLGGLREIFGHVRAEPVSLFTEALIGPWRYATRLHSLGWDPNAERLHALRSRAPTSEKPSCVAAAVLLAAMALPLYPPASDAGRARTTGFVYDGDNYFRWPIVTAPVQIDELRSLLQAGGWRVGERWRRGIAAVYRSRRSEFGQGYAVFRAAQLERPSANTLR
jgi:hypothetical protein